MTRTAKIETFDDNMDMKLEDDIVVIAPLRSEKMSPSQRRPSATTKARKPANLACLNCRPRKIKV